MNEQIILEQPAPKRKVNISLHDPTRLLAADSPGAIEETAGAIKRGELVIFPTDTVYGIGTNAFDEAAVLNLYKAKKRPHDKGIPILLADTLDLNKVAAAIPQSAKLLISRYWPGPLTLIVPKHPDLPASISTSDSVAVRIPANEYARAIIRHAGGAVAASSANHSGEEPARTAAAALAYFNNEVAIILDGGISSDSKPSTIIDCTSPKLQILREGPLSLEELNELFVESD